MFSESIPDEERQRLQEIPKFFIITALIGAALTAYALHHFPAILQASLLDRLLMLCLLSSSTLFVSANGCLVEYRRTLIHLAIFVGVNLSVYFGCRAYFISPEELSTFFVLLYSGIAIVLASLLTQSSVMRITTRDGSYAKMFKQHIMPRVRRLLFRSFMMAVGLQIAVYLYFAIL
ncbi:MAG: hypothetical protein WCV85_04415 [Patescibacteria group bacterium]